MALLDVRDLTKIYRQRQGLFGNATEVRAIDRVSFSIEQGETFGLVGESGSGKTTTGRCILRLIEPTSGQVAFKGQDVLALDRRALRESRRHMQMVFQDPYSSLNPRMRVETIVEEPLVIHAIGTKAERAARVAELLDPRRPRSRAAAPLSARVQRRPAAAHRPGPRAGPQPLADHRRRTGVRARRVDPGAGDQPARRPAGPVRADLPADRPRSAAGPARVHARRGDVSRTDRGDGNDRGRLRARRARLHAGAALRRDRSPIRTRRRRDSSSIAKGSRRAQTYGKSAQATGPRSSSTDHVPARPGAGPRRAPTARVATINARR